MAVRDIIQAAGGSAATSAAVYVEDVFSTYLYTGTGASQTISNGIALGSSNGVVSLKLDFDSSLTDVSSNGYTGTVTGSAARNTSVSKFGSASLDGFDGASWVDYSSSAGNFGSEDWTVEFWIKTTGSGAPGIVTQASGAGAGATSWGIFQGYGTAGNVALYLSDGSNYFASITTGTTVINDNAWHHIAACRSGSTAYLFLDGVLQGTASVGSTALGNGSLPIRVGGQGSGYALPSGTYIDDVRIVKGQALYTSAFTPPSSAVASSITAVVGKGGLVWTKSRSNAYDNSLTDTVTGANKQLYSNLTNSQGSFTNNLTGFLSSGYTLGNDSSAGTVNNNTYTYASWTFRRQAKFFDVVTYTGNGTFDQQIAHSLGCIPGMIIVKCVTSASSWAVYHNDGTTQRTLMSLNGTNASGGTSSGGMTSTYFTPGNIMDASASSPVNNGATYVAYLFAASNSGGFGPAGTDSVVACGSYTADGSGNATVSLGWEPQFVIFKTTNTTSPWRMFDTMRGSSYSTNAQLQANASSAETDLAGFNFFIPTATGFTASSLGSGNTYIYLAIRRGPMKTPTDATKVFSPITYTTSTSGVTLTTGFPVDMALASLRDYNGTSRVVFDRLRGSSSASSYYLQTTSTGAEGQVTSPYGVNIQSNTTITEPYWGTNGNSAVLWNFRRAPGFFDVVCYTGTGSATTVAHNLGVVPELIITKCRVSGPAFPKWWTYSASTGNSSQLVLNETTASVGSSQLWNNTSPTATNFSLGSYDGINGSGYTYVAYLFATCPGVSKVGSFTIDASDVNVDCGFTAGARFVLIKRTDNTGSWLVFDTARGITSGNDPLLMLNLTNAELTGSDWIAPYSAGFTAKASMLGASGATYIFLAIA